MSNRDDILKAIREYCVTNSDPITKEKLRNMGFDQGQVHRGIVDLKRMGILRISVNKKVYILIK